MRWKLSGLVTDTFADAVELGRAFGAWAYAGQWDLKFAAGKVLGHRAFATY